MKLTDTASWNVKVKQGGKRLRALREQRGVSQDELAGASGVPKSLISRLEQGGTLKPDLGMITKLWGALGLSPNRAAQDYGILEHPPGSFNDARLDEVRILLEPFREDKETLDDLVDLLHITVQSYLEHKQRETA